MKIKDVLKQQPPRSLADALKQWPERANFTASPTDWRDEVFYFLMPDRFSDGGEAKRKILGANFLTETGCAKIMALRGANWRWDDYLKSGASRYQGGTLRGVTSKLKYLHGLGVTTIWLAPVFRQRQELDTYHGYGIQDFLDVDPRFGSREDLVSLVDNAHQLGMKVILDVIFNHSGCNWLYDNATGNQFQPGYLPFPLAYDPTWARDGEGRAVYPPNVPSKPQEWVWPAELQDTSNYVRAGSGNLGAGEIDDPRAEHKRTDFCDLRKFNLQNTTLGRLMLAYHYWIALADVDGMRIDTFKHVTFEQARNFCNGIKEYAETVGKDDFFLVAEIAGGNYVQNRYLSISGRNLNACLDIGEQRLTLTGVGKGLDDPATFFGGFDFESGMGSHRNWGSQHLSILDDHDHVFGTKVRFAANAVNDHQAIVPVAFQLFCLGIPCIYYGTEQGLASSVEPSERRWLPWGSSDALLREAMFGPDHPRAGGINGCNGEKDPNLPGFVPFGTSGHHVFDDKSPLYQRIAIMARCRKQFHALRRGRQYRRGVSVLGGPFAEWGAGEICAWSRIFDDQEVLVIVNTHGQAARGGRVLAHATLSGGGMFVAACTDPNGPVVNTLMHAEPVNGETVSFDIAPLGPSEVLILVNQFAYEERKPLTN